MFNIAGNGAGGYNINNSLRFRSSATASLSRTPSVAGNRQTWTWSAWVKRGSLGSYQVLFGAGLNNNVNADELVSIYFTNSDQLGHYVNETSVADRNNISTAVFRDPSAWYHIVAIYDSTNATASNRQRLYVNGVQITSWSATSIVSQNYQPSVNSSSYPHAIGKYGFNNTRYFDGYMTEVNFIDGQALTPSSFGSTDATTGIWIPKKYTGTYGTNGFYLNFSDTSALTTASNAGLGKDWSGNTNYWVTNNISITAGSTYDAMKDSPTLTSATVANYATLNPLQKGTNCTTVDANLKTSLSGANGWDKAIVGTQVISSKSYWEITDQCAAIGTYGNQGFGIVAANVNLNVDPNASTNFITFRDADGQFYNATSLNPAGSGAPFGAGSTNDIYMFAYDPATTKLWAGRNGTWFNSGNPAAGTGAISSTNLGDVLPVIRAYQSGDGPSTINFGQRPFSYTAPTGFNPINTYNLPTSTIVKGNKYMDATLYTGNGGATQSVTGFNFKPDLVWIKARSSALHHGWFDINRGTNATGNNNNRLSSSLTDAETGTYMQSLDATGFTATNFNSTYTNSAVTYVAWGWLASNTTASNTSGTITSTVSVNASAGFSIVTYTGTGANATVGHGLGVAPKMIIAKARSAANNWPVYHVSLGAANAVRLDLTLASAAGTQWNSTTPTSSVFSIGTATETNQNGTTYVAYCWAEIAGFSKAFSYTGNGSTDGSFVYVGFLPRFVMIKRTDTTGDWYMWDTARNTFDVITNTLLANSSAAETSATSIDALSNGFKLRNTTAGFNASGGTYIGMAWASNSFKNSNAF